MRNYDMRKGWTVIDHSPLDNDVPDVDEALADLGYKVLARLGNEENSIDLLIYRCISSDPIYYVVMTFNGSQTEDFTVSDFPSLIDILGKLAPIMQATACLDLGEVAQGIERLRSQRERR